MMLSSATPVAMAGPPHFVDLHVNPGESVSIQMLDGNETILRGPATITMVSQHSFPPVPMPVQVPPGHMVQQIVDENGTLRHIILSALNNNPGGGANTGNGSGSPATSTHPSSCSPSLVGSSPAVTNVTTATTTTPNSQSSPSSQSSNPTSTTTPTTMNGGGTSSGGSPFSYPCCCSCCYCPTPTGAPPGGPVPPSLAGHTLLGCFPPPPQLALPNGSLCSTPVISGSAPHHHHLQTTGTNGHLLGGQQGNNSSSASRRRTPSRSSYAYSKRQQQQQNNQLSSNPSTNNSSSPSHLLASAHHPGHGHPIHLTTQNFPAAMVNGLLPPGPPPFVMPNLAPSVNNKSGSSNMSPKNIKSQHNHHHQSGPVSFAQSTLSVDGSKLFVPSPAMNGRISGQQQQQPQPTNLYYHYQTMTNSTGQGLVKPQSHQPQNLANPPPTLTTTSTTSFELNNSSSTGSTTIGQPFKPASTGKTATTSAVVTGSTLHVNCKAFKPKGLLTTLVSAKQPLATSSPPDGTSPFVTPPKGLQQQPTPPLTNPVLPTTTSTVSSTSVSPNSIDSSSYSSEVSSMDSSYSRSSSSSAAAVVTTAKSVILGNTSTPPGSQARILTTTTTSPKKSAKSSTSSTVKEDSPNESPQSSPVKSGQPTASRSTIQVTSMTITNKNLEQSNNRSNMSTTHSNSQNSCTSSDRKLTSTTATSMTKSKSSPASPVTSVTASPAHNRTNCTQLSSRSTVTKSTPFVQLGPLSSPPIVDQDDVDMPTSDPRLSIVQDEAVVEVAKLQLPTEANDIPNRSDLLLCDALDGGSSTPESPGHPSSSIRRRHHHSSPSSRTSATTVTMRRVNSKASLTSSVDVRDSPSSSVRGGSKKRSRGKKSDSDDEDDVQDYLPPPTPPPARSDVAEMTKIPVSLPKLVAIQSVPSVQLLNLTYTSLTASSVKLKWNLVSSNDPHPPDQHQILILLQQKTSASGGLFTQQFMVEMIHSKPVSVNHEPLVKSEQPEDGSSDKDLSKAAEENLKSNPDVTECPSVPAVRTVYRGNSNNCRVSHLTCGQQYSFRVRTFIDSTYSILSNVLTITTPEQALTTARNVNRVKGNSGRGVTPTSATSNGDASQNSLHTDHKTVTSRLQGGLPTPADKLNQSDLDPDLEEKSDQRRAIMILVVFTVIALVMAVIIQQLLSPSASHLTSVTEDEANDAMPSIAKMTLSPPPPTPIHHHHQQHHHHDYQHHHHP